MPTPKLLLADDSATIRKVVELTFADEGIHVFAVADGEAAMQKFIEVQPDIVLVDVEMPGPTGYQICEMIKQDEATCHIPVLLLVGSFEPFDQDEAERVNADGFLTKPFQSIRDLVVRVNELLIAGEPELAVGPETEDIEELYISSFADTLPLEKYDTEMDLFEEGSFDSFSGEPVFDTPAISVPERPFDEMFTEVEIPQPAYSDSSPEDTSGPFETIKDEKRLTQSNAPSFNQGEGHADPFDDVTLDDEMIETVHFAEAERDEDISSAGGDSSEIKESEETIPTTTYSSEIDEPEAPSRDNDFVADGETATKNDHFPRPESEAQAVKDFDWSPAAKIVEEPSQHQGESSFEPRFIFADTDTVEGIRFSHESEVASVPTEVPAERPSEELIALIAQRVIESLSDRTIREIAQDAVPRIAEKLIREALEDDNKK